MIGLEINFSKFSLVTWTHNFDWVDRMSREAPNEISWNAYWRKSKEIEVLGNCSQQNRKEIINVEMQTTI